MRTLLNAYLKNRTVSTALRLLAYLNRHPFAATAADMAVIADAKELAQ